MISYGPKIFFKSRLIAAKDSNAILNNTQREKPQKRLTTGSFKNRVLAVILLPSQSINVTQFHWVIILKLYNFIILPFLINVTVKCDLVFVLTQENV